MKLRNNIWEVTVVDSDTQGIITVNVAAENFDDVVYIAKELYGSDNIRRIFATEAEIATMKDVYDLYDSQVKAAAK